ncbi:ChaC-like protein [Pseudorhodobacter antarcticus]|jgi:hypothetical protein|uniref:glutathione-specific gamma-glutamylcyclotransferase n=1 Tax=Pseudorhodobacter antarcticus TaxID=1077947 RepID=A0A1H8B6W6_9RHOB|nr:gamma-glutamylcyclotransferase family protein [Pseudorhodobacter antarcticus]SEM78602.1 ChaC-like protein [Pseudorhodobacter antarcticus]
MTHHFFGYGSLVNRATHSYPNARPATLRGWRRAWVHTPDLTRSFLSVIPDPTCTIMGLVAEVPGGDWSALDLREQGYTRSPDHAMVGDHPHPIQVYAVPGGNPPSDHAPILLSYLDAVIQGFLIEYGHQGTSHFFSTTTGWNAPILDDRAAPQYPRAQRLSDAELAVVDAGLRTARG